MAASLCFFDELIRTEVLVIGAGVAGLSAALSASPRQVLVLSKGTVNEGSSSALAQGGIASAVGKDDAPFLHAQDTLSAGAGLCDKEIVSRIISEGPNAIHWLESIGTIFDKNPDKTFSLGREAAHSRRRVLHCDGDRTGIALVKALAQEVQRHKQRITVLENIWVQTLIQDTNGHVIGALAINKSRKLLISAGVVILASGGSGQLYQYTTNPKEATADGIALAAELGASLSDLEFVQFHPTALRSSKEPLPLLTEALRGEGAYVIDENEERFLFNYDERGELASRDIVARSIWQHVLSGHRAFLDARGLRREEIEGHFPGVSALCKEAGLSLDLEPVPITPAAHYHMGGVLVDAMGQTSIHGLYACGEVSCMGFHGANRLASNSLLEGIVQGVKVASSLFESMYREPETHVVVDGLSRALPERIVHFDEQEVQAHRKLIRDLMFRDVGLVRDKESLKRAQGHLSNLFEQLKNFPSELRNMCHVGLLISSAALLRRESRGAHYRSDYPHANSAFERRQIIHHIKGGANYDMKVEWRDVSSTKELSYADRE